MSAGGLGDHGWARYLVVAAGLALGAATYIYAPQPYSAIISPFIVVAAFFLGIIGPVMRRKMADVSVDIDLVYLVGHMLSIATGKPPRAALFKSVGEGEPYPKYSALFKKIYVLGSQWGYSFAEACRLVALSIRNKLLQNMLSRLSGILAVGEDVEAFLSTEYGTFMSEYETQYGRLIDAMRVFLGLYTTMLGSTIFILANFLLLAFFFGGNSLVVFMSFLGVSASAAALLILLYKMVPRDLFEHSMSVKPRELRLVTISGAMSLAVVIPVALAYMAGGASFEKSSIVFILAGGLFLGPGLAAKLVEKRVKELDDFFPVFIRSYGMHLSTIPSMPKALEPLLISQLGRLNLLLRGLYARLKNGIDPRIAWRLFAGETGSELIRRGVRMFLDTVEYGGDVAKAGELISDHQNLLLRLRRARTQVAKTFETTTYIMHASVIMITVFVAKLILFFSQILASLQAQVPPEVAGVFSMGALQPGILVASSLVFIVVSTITNALAIVRALPGLKQSVWFYLSILLLVGGVSMLLGSKLLDIVVKASIGSLKNIVGAVPHSP